MVTLQEPMQRKIKGSIEKTRGKLFDFIGGVIVSRGTSDQTQWEQDS
jgi:hypothetical protein